MHILCDYSTLTLSQGCLFILNSNKGDQIIRLYRILQHMVALYTENLRCLKSLYSRKVILLYYLIYSVLSILNLFSILFTVFLDTSIDNQIEYLASACYLHRLFKNISLNLLFIFFSQSPIYIYMFSRAFTVLPVNCGFYEYYIYQHLHLNAFLFKFIAY